MLLGIGTPLIGRLLLYDALDMSVEFVKLKKNPKCRVCGPDADITELIDYEAFCGVPGHDHVRKARPARLLISPHRSRRTTEAERARSARCAGAART